MEGRMLGMERVPYSKSLQVFNIGNITRDGLEAYFENNKRSGGSGDVTVQIDEKQGCAIVTFESHKSKFIFVRSVFSILCIPFLIQHIDSKTNIICKEGKQKLCTGGQKGLL